MGRGLSPHDNPGLERQDLGIRPSRIARKPGTNKRDGLRPGSAVPVALGPGGGDGEVDLAHTEHQVRLMAGTVVELLAVDGVTGGGNRRV